MLIGILGLGSIGDRHARNLMALGHQVIAYDQACPTGFSRYDVLTKSEAVLICTPTKSHAVDLADALHHGKHVFVEKPIGYDCPPYIAGLIAGAKSTYPGIVIATGFNLRFHQCVKDAKNLIEDGFLGKLQSARFDVLQKNSRPDYLRDGVILNWMSHELDLARYLLGEIYVVHATCDTHETIASVELLASAHEDAPITIVANYITDPELRRFTIVGDENTIHCDLVARILTAQREHRPHDDINIVYYDSFDRNYIDEISAFIQAIEGRHDPRLADGFDGVSALQLVVDAKEKAKSDG